MEKTAQQVEADIEDRHWWFAGRRQLFAREIGKLGIAGRGAVLDAGSGTGANLRMLHAMGFDSITGLDPSAEAVRQCHAKGLLNVRHGDICAMDLADETFDLVLATDVLEHVDEDVTALREIYRVLKPGGHVLITVPCFMMLWGLQDDVSHHKRRYLRGELLARSSEAGFRTLRSYYFNYLLFVPIFLARRMMALLGVRLKSENQISAPVMDTVLRALFMADIRSAPIIKPPFGVSTLLLAQKPLET